LKNQKVINAQIKAAERELAAIDAKRAALQDRIKQLQSLKQSIADEQLPFNRQPVINLTNESDEKQKIAIFRSLSEGGKMFFQENLPPSLKNRLIRLAAFQNPEFYKAQAMRFPTYDKPRIVHCCEDFYQHIGLPRGCLEDVVDLLESHGIQIKIRDERLDGFRLKVHFRGELRQEQKKAVEAVLAYENGVLSAATAFGKTMVAA
jgi:hypothetical protein